MRDAKNVEFGMGGVLEQTTTDQGINLAKARNILFTIREKPWTYEFDGEDVVIIDTDLDQSPEGRKAEGRHSPHHQLLPCSNLYKRGWLGSE